MRGADNFSADSLIVVSSPWIAEFADSAPAEGLGRRVETPCTGETVDKSLTYEENRQSLSGLMGLNMLLSIRSGWTAAPFR